MHFDKIGCDDFVLREGYPLPQIINVQSSGLNTIIQSDIYSQVKLGLRSFRVFQILMNRSHVLSVHKLNGQIWLVVINAMIGITGYVSDLPNVPGESETWSCRNCVLRSKFK